MAVYIWRRTGRATREKTGHDQSDDQRISVHVMPIGARSVLQGITSGHVDAEPQPIAPMKIARERV